MWRQVHYNDVTVGEYFAARLVEDVPVVEANAVKALDNTHLAPGACPGGRMRCANYLKATCLQLCLLRNFGKLRLKTNAWSTACGPH
jgi:PD-(D/E)XK nuclease superfamily